MKRARFTEEQIIWPLRENDARVKMGELARKHRVSEGTIYAWKAKFGGMCVSETWRLKSLLADTMLDKAAVKELLSKNGRARRHARRHRSSADGVRDQRAAGLLYRQGGPQDVRYRSRRPPDTELRERLRGLAAERRGFGYRRLFVLLRREGELSGKSIYRLYARRA